MISDQLAKAIQQLKESIATFDKAISSRVPQYGDKYRDVGEILLVWRYLPDHPNDVHPWMLTDDKEIITWNSDKEAEARNLRLVQTAGGTWGQHV